MESRTFAGKYSTVRELGADAGGRTWLASGPDGGQYVVRVVRRSGSDALDAMEHDIAAMSGVRHAALATIHEWGHDSGEFFVVREYVAGADLKTELELQGRFAPFTVARYGADVAGALELIHEHGVAHGNVSTANLLRLPADDVKLVGGGTGAPWEAAASSAAPAAAAHYLAPELVEGGAPSPASDVYALGVVLYELVTGQLPFDGESGAEVADRQLHEAPAPVGQLVQDVPSSLEAVIMRALEKTPEARWPSAGAMSAELARVEADEAPSRHDAETAPPAKPRRWIWALVAAIVLIAGLGAAWALGVLPGVGTAVPDLVGRTLVDARAQIIAAGFEPGSVTYSGVSAMGIADGMVAQQTPAAGVRAQQTAKVDLVLAGRELISVPDVAGIAEARALATLADAGLTVGTVSRVSTTAVAVGIVTSQAPEQGQQAAKGTAVDLWIAQAPTPVPVPDVTGLPQADARADLISAGFAVKSITQASTTVANGRVIEQVPTAGVTAQPGSMVTIRVSTGPARTTVPDVVGQTQADAVNALGAVGFLPRVKLRTGGGTSGTVIDQSPAGGTRTTTGTTVDVTVVR